MKAVFHKQITDCFCSHRITKISAVLVFDTPAYLYHPREQCQGLLVHAGGRQQQVFTICSTTCWCSSISYLLHVLLLIFESCYISLVLPGFSCQCSIAAMRINVICKLYKCTWIKCFLFIDETMATHFISKAYINVILALNDGNSLLCISLHSVLAFVCYWSHSHKVKQNAFNWPIMTEIANYLLI